MKKTIAIIALVLSIAGCATVGNKIDWDKARQVKTGMTQQEVSGLLGKPYMVAANADGTQKWVWVYANGWTGSSGSATLTFTRDGRVEKAFEVPANF